MNSIYLGDRPLDPPEEPERPTEPCEACSGWGWIEFDGDHAGCAVCEGTGQVELTDAELAQQQFDDFDPPDCGDFGEPL